MELKDLVGEHLLSGFDTATKKAKNTWSEDAEVIRFVLDGVTYKATGDSSDDYRSYLKEIEVTTETITNTFKPQKVVGKMKDNNNYEINDTIQFIDAVTGKIVLEVGTNNTDDYYPYCVMNWSPKNLAINVGL